MQAQPFPKFSFNRITTKDGLPSNIVSCIFKDSRGFLWFGTLEGLSRYDGKNFKNYAHNPGNDNSLIGNNIFQIDEDKEGHIWANAYIDGISCLDVHTDRFINYHPNEKDSLGMKGRYGMILDSNSIVYTNATQWLDKTNGTWRTILQVQDSLNRKDENLDNVKREFVKLNDKTVWQFGYNGIFKLDTEHKKFLRYFGQLNDPLCFFKDHSGRYWYGDWVSGLNEVLFKEKKLKNYIPQSRINYIDEYKDIYGKYWIIACESKGGKIIIMDPETGKYSEQLFKTENELIPTTWPGKSFIDTDHKIWIASSNGVFVSGPIAQSFKNIWQYDRTKAFDPFYNGLVRTIFKVRDQYAVALLANGVKLYDSSFKEVKYIKYFRDRAGNKVIFDVRAALALTNGNYILSGPTGAFIWNPNGSYKYLCKVPIADSTHYDYNGLWREMLPINENEYWVKFGLNYMGIYNLNTDCFLKIYKLYKIKPEIESYNICYDAHKTLWVSTNRGIFHYDEKTDAFINEQLKPRQPKDEYATNDVTFINAADTGYLWISTYAGLLKYHIATHQTQYIDTAENKLKQVFRTAFSNNGKLWIANYLGLSVYDTVNHQIKNFGIKDGLPLGSYDRDIGFLINEKQELLFGGEGVFSVINLRGLGSLKEKPPQVVIMHIKGKDSLLAFCKSAVNQYQAAVSFRDFPVQVLFNIISFEAGGERKYYYKMDGVDTSWQQLESGSFSLNTIAPGNYRIWLTGSLNGVWANNPQSVTITIVPQWYQTKTFKIVAILLSAFTLFLFYKWRLNTARKSERQKTEIEKLSAAQYKNQLELSQITNYFSSSLLNKNSVEDVLWDVAKNLIGKLGFEDCMIYLWDSSKTKMIQKAGYGPKGSIEEIDKQPFDVITGQGVVGHVMQTKEPVIISNTTIDSRYRQDEMQRLSEMCVPIMYNDELIGIMDSEHHQKKFYTQRHLQLLQTIAALIANKIKSIESESQAQQATIEIIEMRQQLKSAQLDALRSQMDPHFIFNSLNSIENFILKNERLLASEYLGKFSKLIRNILDNSKKETIPIEQEIDTLKIYIELERLRMNNYFEVQYEIEESVLESDISIPPMLLQPYIENAILHGIRLRDDRKGKLIIKMYLCDPNSLCYLVHDNGIGRKKAGLIKAEKKPGHQSYGTAITQSRIDIYNQLNKVQVTVSTTDLYDSQTGESTGTQVEMIIPV